MRSQKPESGTIVGTAKCSQLSELVGGLGGGTSSQKPLSRESATKGTEQSGRRSGKYAEYLPTHGAGEEPGECVERSLATHGTDEEPGECAERSLATHGTDEEPGECAERSLATHGADEEPGECVERSLATHGAEEEPGECVERSLATHGADEEPCDCAERSLASHGADDLVIWTSDRTEFRGEFEAKDGSDRPSRLSSRVAVGQAPEAYVQVAKFGVGQEDFIRNPSGS
ncbi:hypothetical protein PF011_g25135 [Phytophthora fragariae]|uniref:Uncharacterized protein n=1 Tax=Phytophthora fragariae TaxID=53985 RepID=A0A6A3HY77_9STRA|nr:hypothetical protein PF011_g25135 [Phytophthora fragariae]